MKNEKQMGFSLLEMMIVISLIALLFSFGSYQFIAYLERQKLLQTAQQLSQFLHVVQFNANIQNKTFKLQLRDESNALCLMAFVAKSYVNECKDQLHYLIEKKNNVKLIYPEKEIAFYGHRNRAQGGTISVMNRIGSISIIISRDGRLRFCSSVPIASYARCRIEEGEE